MIKYIFFDLDETLIDIKKSQRLASEYFYKYYNFDSKTNLVDFTQTWADLTDYHYAFYARKEISYEEQRIRRIRDLFNKYKVDMDKTEIEIYDIYLKFFEDNWCLFSDVEDSLEKLNNLGYKIGVISNGNLKQQKKKLQKTGIMKYIFDVTTASEYNFSKPDVRLYEIACKKNNINFNEICYIGNDYKKDILPCLSIGIKAIWLNRKNKKLDDVSVEQISNLNELFNKI